MSSVKLPVCVTEHEIHAPDSCDYVCDESAFYHSRHGLEIAEARRPHMHSVGLRGAVSDNVVAQFSARRFNHTVHFAFRHPEPFSDDLEVKDESGNVKYAETLFIKRTVGSTTISATTNWKGVGARGTSQDDCLIREIYLIE